MAVGGSVHEWPAAAAGPGPIDRRPADAPEPRFLRNRLVGRTGAYLLGGTPPSFASDHVASVESPVVCRRAAWPQHDDPSADCPAGSEWPGLTESRGRTWSDVATILAEFYSPCRLDGSRSRSDGSLSGGTELLALEEHGQRGLPGRCPRITEAG